MRLILPDPARLHTGFSTAWRLTPDTRPPATLPAALVTFDEEPIVTFDAQPITEHR